MRFYKKKYGMIFFRTFIWCGVLIGLLFVLGFVEKKNKEQICKEVNINIDVSNGMFFINKKIVKNTIRNLGIEPEGDPMRAMELERIEKALHLNPVTNEVEVFKTINGKLKINITQRKPIARIKSSKEGVDFYLDRQGKYMPLSSEYTPQVVIVNGFVDNLFKAPLNSEGENNNLSALKLSKESDFFDFVNFLNYNDFWNSQILQVYVNKKGGLELIPRVGKQRIMFGKINRIEKKFNKLYNFYKKGLNYTDWNKYDTIDLKFKDQIVCKKDK